MDATTPEDPFAWLDQPLPPRHVPAATPEPGALAAVVDSPFIPGTLIQYAWDSTSLGYFKRCPRYYQYKQIEGWQKNDESIDLRFGILYHRALQNYELALVEGANHEAALRYALYHLLVGMEIGDEALPDTDHPLKTRSTLVRTVIWYLDKYEIDPAHTVILANGKPAIEVSFRFEIDVKPKTIPDRAYLLCGHLDRVVTFHDQPFVLDRKTTRYTPDARFFGSFNPDNQVSLYSIAGRLLFGVQLQGVIIDAAQIAVGFSRFGRAPIARSEGQLTEWLRDLEVTLDYAETCAVHRHWPQNDTSCDKYGGCEFRRICAMSPDQRLKFLPGTHKKGEPWNPLKPR